MRPYENWWLEPVGPHKHGGAAGFEVHLIKCKIQACKPINDVTNNTWHVFCSWESLKQQSIQLFTELFGRQWDPSIIHHHLSRLKPWPPHCPDFRLLSVLLPVAIEYGLCTLCIYRLCIYKRQWEGAVEARKVIYRVIIRPNRIWHDWW